MHLDQVLYHSVKDRRLKIVGSLHFLHQAILSGLNSVAIILLNNMVAGMDLRQATSGRGLASTCHMVLLRPDTLVPEVSISLKVQTCTRHNRCQLVRQGNDLRTNLVNNILPHPTMCNLQSRHPNFPLTTKRYPKQRARGRLLHHHKTLPRHR
jgi:hypothetical protein